VGGQFAILDAQEEFRGGPPGAPAFYFERGTPSLVIEITERFARRCGPFVIVCPEADQLTVVWPGTSGDQEWVSTIPPDAQ
jgi:hypothetical protein